VDLPSSAEYAIVWEAGRRSIEGRVVAAANGKPVAGAEVVAGLAKGLSAGSMDRAVTGEDGTFRVLVSERDGVVEVHARGFSTTTVPVDSGANEKIDVPLARTARIRGVVTRRSDGGPVEGVEVRVLRSGRSEQRWSWPGTFQTGADGRFET